jgi:2-haloacid dehalogenase
MDENNNGLINRRSFINLTAGGIAATALLGASPVSFAAEKSKIEAIAFDAFPIFNPKPVFDTVTGLYPEAAALINTWRTAQFEYTWLRTTAGQYKNFLEVTEDALVFAAKKNDVDLTTANRKQIIDSYRHLTIWPDVLPVLKTLKETGIRLCFLSNFTEDMLSSNIKNNQLDGYFEHLLSTDRVKAFKPSPDAYQTGIDVLKLKKEEIAFAAFAGWDAVGAKWFGYPTYWVNRQNAPLDELSVVPDASGKDLTGLPNFIK